MICENCGHDQFQPARVRQTFDIDGKLTLVDNIPASVCMRCGAENFSADVAEHIRQLVRAPHKTVSIIEAEHIEYQTV